MDELIEMDQHCFIDNLHINHYLFVVVDGFCFGPVLFKPVQRIQF